MKKVYEYLKQEVHLYGIARYQFVFQPPAARPVMIVHNWRQYFRMRLYLTRALHLKLAKAERVKNR